MAKKVRLIIIWCWRTLSDLCLIFGDDLIYIFCVIFWMHSLEMWDHVSSLVEGLVAAINWTVVWILFGVDAQVSIQFCYIIEHLEARFSRVREYLGTPFSKLAIFNHILNLVISRSIWMVRMSRLLAIVFMILVRAKMAPTLIQSLESSVVGLLEHVDNEVLAVGHVVQAWYQVPNVDMIWQLLSCLLTAWHIILSVHDFIILILTLLNNFVEAWRGLNRDIPIAGWQMFVWEVFWHDLSLLKEINLECTIYFYGLIWSKLRLCLLDVVHRQLIWLNKFQLIIWVTLRDNWFTSCARAWAWWKLSAK